MTTPRKASITAATITTLTLSLSSGCGTLFETREAACLRVIDHFADCAAASGAEEQLDMVFGMPLDDMCTDIPETDDRNYSAIADCITSLPCKPGDAPPSLATQLNCLSALQSQ